MGFDPDKYKVLEEVDLGQVNGWQGNMKVVKYKYGENPESVKVVIVGKTKQGKEYESKIISGLPAAVLKEKILPVLTEMVG